LSSVGIRRVAEKGNSYPKDIQKVMRALALAYQAKELNSLGFTLYERFRISFLSGLRSDVHADAAEPGPEELLSCFFESLRSVV